MKTAGLSLIWLLSYYLVLREILDYVDADGKEQITAALEETLLFDIPKEVIETTSDYLSELNPALLKKAAAKIASGVDGLYNLDLWSWHEQLLHKQQNKRSQTSKRKGLGSYYTTKTITTESLEILDLSTFRLDELLVLDPACGTGNFLVAFYEVARRRGFDPRQVKSRLYGIEIDDVAARLCRARLLLLEPCLPVTDATSLTAQIVCADALSLLVSHRKFTRRETGTTNKAALRCELPLGDFTHVIGNPPFINRIRAASSGGNNSPSLLTHKTRGLIRAAPYTDISAIFLDLATDVLKDNGWIVMVQPISFLATRDSQEIRLELLRNTRLRAAVFDQSKSFSAVVDTVTLVLHKGSPSSHYLMTIIVISKMGSVQQRSITLNAESNSMSQLVAIAAGVPLPSDLPLYQTNNLSCISEMAYSTADFRDQYYFIKSNVYEGSIEDSRNEESLKVITVGSIDPSKTLWGEREVLLGGRKFLHPTLSMQNIENPRTLKWLTDRSKTKILVATQSEIIESVIDLSGKLIGSVPVITVTPKQEEDVFAVQAALCSSVLSAVAIGRHLGAGLSYKALKLSASQIAALPLPSHHEHWVQAAEIHRYLSEHQEQSIIDVLKHIKEADMNMQAAYGVYSNELHVWWFERVTHYLRRHHLRSSSSPSS